MTAPKVIEFGLLKNAMDSLRQAVEVLAFSDFGSDETRLKLAITSAAHCVELLLKERLRRINPAFVWENVDKYPSMGARTVTVDTAIGRLKSIGNVKLLPSDEHHLRSLRVTRNAIEHYEWHATVEEARVIVGNALSFAFAFAHEELGLDLESEFRRDITWKTLTEELYTFAAAHSRRLEARMRAKGDHPQDCDECGGGTVPMGGGSCELCGHWQAIDNDM